MINKLIWWKCCKRHTPYQMYYKLINEILRLKFLRFWSCKNILSKIENLVCLFCTILANLDRCTNSNTPKLIPRNNINTINIIISSVPISSISISSIQSHPYQSHHQSNHLSISISSYHHIIISYIIISSIPSISSYH